MHFFFLVLGTCFLFFFFFFFSFYYYFSLSLFWVVSFFVVVSSAFRFVLPFFSAKSVRVVRGKKSACGRRFTCSSSGNRSEPSGCPAYFCCWNLRGICCCWCWSRSKSNRAATTAFHRGRTTPSDNRRSGFGVDGDDDGSAAFSPRRDTLRCR